MGVGLFSLLDFLLHNKFQSLLMVFHPQFGMKLLLLEHETDVVLFPAKCICSKVKADLHFPLSNRCLFFPDPLRACQLNKIPGSNILDINIVHTVLDIYYE